MDFEWDRRVFPDPQAMLRAAQRPRACASASGSTPTSPKIRPCLTRAWRTAICVKRPDGDVWQWDRWQAGMGLVDFTNPEACRWYGDKLRGLLDMGVDCFKTDFGERIPADVVYHDGSDPVKMHNYYTYLYNKTVFEVLEDKVRRGQRNRLCPLGHGRRPAVPRALGRRQHRNLRVDGRESARRPVVVALSALAFGATTSAVLSRRPPPEVYKRWCAFGLLSSHSRLHGSQSYRVPWLFDDEVGRCAALFHQAQVPVDALSLRCGGPGAHDRASRSCAR